MTREIFISYATADRAVAEDLCEALEASGLNCWIAPRNIEPGSNWTASIMSAIAECRIMMLIFSSKCNDSSHVVREILHAVEKRRQVLPIRIEEVVPTGGLEYCLVGVQWFDATLPPLSEHIDNLAAQIRSVLLRSGDPSPAPTPPGSGAAAPEGETSDIYFSCDRCGQSLVVDATAAGQDFACPNCQNTVTIPPPADSPPPKQPWTAGKSGAGSKRRAPAAAAFDRTLLAELRTTLATYVGPLANVLVKRAAAQAGTMPELLDLLAAEIDLPGDREQFLEAAKSLHSE